MAQATFTVQLEFEAADQTKADAKRDKMLLRFARYHRLDVFVKDAEGVPTAAVDQAALRREVRGLLGRIVRECAQAQRQRELAEQVRQQLSEEDE
jgi:hypothetical protein